MAEPVVISHQQWLEQSKYALKCHSQSPDLDARVLLCHCLQRSLSYLLAWPERLIPPDVTVQLNALLQRRINGEPIAYIVGYREFWSMNFIVTPEVLIPRPETELLVEWALQHIDASDNDVKILELGTGSGVIAIALAKEHPQLQITATDLSEKALVVAEENARHNDCTHIHFLQGSWFECISEEGFDIILSNPPYIAENDPHLEQGDLPFEPISSLVAANKGLADIEYLVKQSKHYLNTDGWLAIEHGHDQGEAVKALMQQEGYQLSKTMQDLSGIDRITIGCCSAEGSEDNE